MATREKAGGGLRRHILRRVLLAVAVAVLIGAA